MLHGTELSLSPTMDHGTKPLSLEVVCYSS